jgi:hypothetical protein
MLKMMFMIITGRGGDIPMPKGLISFGLRLYRAVISKIPEYQVMQLPERNCQGKIKLAGHVAAVDSAGLTTLQEPTHRWVHG